MRSPSSPRRRFKDMRTGTTIALGLLLVLIFGAAFLQFVILAR